MKRLFLIEPVIGIYAFASFLVYPLVQQYVYRRLWKDITNTTYPISDNSSRCALTNISSNHTNQNEEVQRQASLFSLYSELFSIIPSLTVTLLLVAYSDQRGRKITIVLPLIGSLIYTLCFLALSYFELNVYLLIGASLLSSLFGGLGTFLGGCFAYVADLCEDGRSRTLRMAGVDMVIGLVSGVASLSSGYFLRAAGFNWPFFTGAILQCFCLLYAVFILGETVKKPEGDAAIAVNGGPRCSGLKQMLYGIYHLYAGATCRQNALIVLILLIFATFSFAYVGGLSMITLYELNAPLCWSEILIGYGSALSTSVFLVSFLGVSVFMYCGVPQLLIVLMGILSVMSGMILLAFAHTTTMMFLVRLPMLLAIMPFPVLRGMMSKIVSKTEQGALFACVAFVDSLSSNIAYTVFTTIYAATVSWFPGFIFLLAAGLCSVPIALVGVVCVLGTDHSKEEKEDSETLISGEEVQAEDQNDNAPVC